MKYSHQLRTYGYIKQATKQGDKEKLKNEAVIAEKNRIKDICLNCKEKKCVSRCKYFSKRERV
jgi:hypothetical protein